MCWGGIRVVMGWEAAVVKVSRGSYIMSRVYVFNKFVTPERKRSDPFSTLRDKDAAGWLRGLAL